MPPRKSRVAVPLAGEDHQPSTTNPSATATTRLTRSAARKAAEAEKIAKVATAAVKGGGAATVASDAKLTDASSNSKTPPKSKAKRITSTVKVKAPTATETETINNSPKKRGGKVKKAAGDSLASLKAPSAKQSSLKTKKEDSVPIQLSSPPAEVELEKKPPKPKVKSQAKKSVVSKPGKLVIDLNSNEAKLSPEAETIQTTQPALSISAISSALPQKESRMVSRSRTKRAREDVLTNGDTNVVELSQLKAKKQKITPSKSSRSVNSKYSEQVCKAWFETYATPETELIDTPKAIQWFDELGISIGCVAYFVLAYKLAAKTLFTITRQEFMEGMKKLNIDSNEKLRLKLPLLLSELQPSHKSEQFRAFYKFCFEYIKSGEPAGSKNIPMDPWAIEFLSLTLDKKKYSVDYQPPEDEAMADERKAAEKGDENFPHLHAFVQFLRLKKPVKVLTKDQWDCFLPFNKSVGWDLDGYDEAESSWPSLFDQYIEWKRQMSDGNITGEVAK